jgi:hypothetical protein
MKETRTMRKTKKKRKRKKDEDGKQGEERRGSRTERGQCENLLQEAYHPHHAPTHAAPLFPLSLVSNTNQPPEPTPVVISAPQMSLPGIIIATNAGLSSLASCLFLSAIRLNQSHFSALRISKGPGGSQAMQQRGGRERVSTVSQHVAGEEERKLVSSNLSSTVR